MSIGTICVDATPAAAVISVGGEVFTERCLSLTQAYTSNVIVTVSAPGFETETQEVWLMGTKELEIDLKPMAPEAVE